MARLPEPGRDAGQWGEILNDFLLQSLNVDGSLKNNSISSLQLQNGSVTSSKIANLDGILADMIDGAAIVNDHLILTTHSGEQIDLGSIRGPKGDTGDTGQTGEVGPAGAQGNQGVAGPANSLSIGTVTTLAAGNSATAGITGTAPSQTMNLGIPQGDKGENGDRSTSTNGVWSTAAQTINGAVGPQSIRRTLQTNVTLTFVNPNPGSTIGFTISLTLRQDVTGGRTITWPTEIIWPEKFPPVLPTASNAITVVHLYWDGGNWFGALMGQNFG